MYPSKFKFMKGWLVGRGNGSKGAEWALNDTLKNAQMYSLEHAELSFPPITYSGIHIGGVDCLDMKVGKTIVKMKQDELSLTVHAPMTAGTNNAEVINGIVYCLKHGIKDGIVIHPTDDRNATEETMVAFLTQIKNVFKTDYVNICVENMHRSLPVGNELIGILKHCQNYRCRIGLCLDVWHLVSCGFGPALETTLDICRRAKFLDKIHITDGHPGLTDNHCGLGDGLATPYLPAVVDFAKKYKILTVLEVPPGCVKSSMKYLDSLN